jgi:hypothetical protein
MTRRGRGPALARADQQRGHGPLFTGHVDLAIAEFRRALEIEPSSGLAKARFERIRALFV